MSKRGEYDIIITYTPDRRKISPFFISLPFVPQTVNTIEPVLSATKNL